MRQLLQPILLEFFRAHLILTAVSALLLVLALGLSSLLGFGENLLSLISPRMARASGLAALLPAIPILGLCLLAYLPAGRFAQSSAGLPRPDAVTALQLLLLPAAVFWLLLAAGGLLSNVGAQLVALLLNCPAYGVVTLIGLLTGGQSTAPRWTAYGGGLAAGLLPPLLFLAGSCIPIPALDRKDPEDHIEIQ